MNITTYYLTGARMTLRSNSGCQHDQVLDPQWVSFNYTLLPPNNPMPLSGAESSHDTSFGAGSRLVWLVNTTLCQLF